MSELAWRPVASFAYRPQADVVASVLDGHGIPARVRGDDAGGVAPHVGWITGGITVEVPAERADEARQLLAEAEPDPTTELEEPDVRGPERGTLPGDVGSATAAASGAAPLLGVAALVRRLRDRRRRPDDGR